MRVLDLGVRSVLGPNPRIGSRTLARQGMCGNIRFDGTDTKSRTRIRSISRLIRGGDPPLCRHGCNQDIPGDQGLALLSTLTTIVWCLALYGQGMLDTAGELALLSMTLFMVGMAA